MTAFQRVEEASHHNPETGNVLIQQLYRDWYKLLLFVSFCITCGDKSNEYERA